MTDEAIVERFKKDWSITGEPMPELTPDECDFIVKAQGPRAHQYLWWWNIEPDAEAMAAALAASPNITDRIGPLVLKALVGRGGTDKAVRVLLEHGVPLEIKLDEFNVVHNAGWAGATETLRAVFEHGVVDAKGISVKKPHTGWPDNISLMYWAAWGGYPEMARLLLKYGAREHHERQIKVNGERGTTSLHEAIAPGPRGDDHRVRGKREVAQIIIDDGAYYDILSASGLDDQVRLKALLSENPQLATDADPYGMTPLHWAARAGAIDSARLLIGANADVNAANKAHRTPLHLAADDGQIDIISLLVEHGANIDVQDKVGRTALHRATYGGQAEAAERLLTLGADPWVLNKKGKNAFEIARKDAKYFKQRSKE